MIEPSDFKFTHFQHDLARYICYGIESAGHECAIIRNSTLPDRMNIILGANRLQSPVTIQVPYIILQAEVLGTYFSVEQVEKIQLPLWRSARAVWTNVESQKALKTFGIKSKIFTMGYHPQMKEITHKKNKDIDFLFYGSITPHRNKMLAALRERNPNIIVLFDEAHIFRNDYIARTKVHLSLTHDPAETIFAGSRVLYLVNNGCTVVVEDANGQEPYTDCFPHAPTDKWVDLCIKTLKAPDRSSEYYANFKKIKMADIMAKLIGGL